MASTVFFHIGVPKSGSTYLQSALWQHASALRAAGVMLPATGHTDHRWGSLVVRADRRLRHRPPRALGAWDRIVDDVAAWSGTAVISHEFYGGASIEQAEQAVAALAPAEVHLVVTARDPLRALTSAWQETLKYGNAVELDHFSTSTSADPSDIWNWRALDIAEVLARWGDLVPAEHVHVLPVPRQAEPEVLWHRFAGLFLSRPSALPPAQRPHNPSIGLVACEAMRRVGPYFEDLTALPRSTWVRNYLADTVLSGLASTDGGVAERFLPGADRVQECRARGKRAAALVRAAGYDVRGELEDLLVPDRLPDLRIPAEVGSDEVIDMIAGALAVVVRDMRESAAKEQATRREAERLRRRLENLRRRLEKSADSSRLGPWGRSLRRMWSARRRSDPSE